jgi:hypothetical protein
MLAWKANVHIDFNFTNCQLQQEIRSEDEAYIKRLCRERIDMSGTFVQLIGADTRWKYKYVRWEAEVAIEKGCTIIGANLDGARRVQEATCPPIIRDVGAVFVPFSPRIIQYALEHWTMMDGGAWHYNEHVYTELGYPRG